MADKHHTDRKATIKATGDKITVYRHESRGWVLSADCKTEYTVDELDVERG